MNSISYLFNPRSIAVVGATPRKDSVGQAIFSNILRGDFNGIVYPVNPQRDGVLGVKCYRTVADIPGEVDLAILLVPPSATAQALDDCGAKGAKAAIIVSAGFKEVGPAGAVFEQDLIRVARKWEIPVMGPNCLGLINTDSSVRLNASFARVMPREGNIAFLSQSGALLTAVLDLAAKLNIGFSKFISMGNKAVLNELDLLRYLATDDKTALILMYVEDLSNGQEFIRMAREITGEGPHPKPILTIKSGRSPEGGKAAASHTGSMMGSDEVYDAIFEQSGVDRVETIEELFHYALAFSNLPLPKGNRVGIVTNAGGPGIMAVDACKRYGMEIARFEPATTSVLRAALPATANIANPVDVIGDAQHDRYGAAVDAVLADPNVDAAIVILTPQAMTDIEEIARTVVKADRSKPLMASFMGVRDVSTGVDILTNSGIPHYTFPESAARALAALLRHSRWRTRPRTTERHFDVDQFAAERVMAASWKRRADYIAGTDAERLLAAYGFPTLKSAVATNPASAVSSARQFGYPVVLKVVAKNVLHKFNVGGVKLNIAADDEVLAAFEEIQRNLRERLPEAEFQGVLVQETAPPGKEVILGVKRDPHFGPIIMFGMGGVYVEALKDVTFRLAPIRELSAHDMIQSIRAISLLKGVRGEPPSDTAAIAECLMRLSQLVTEHPEIAEMDINPLVVYPSGARVVDARVIFSWEKVTPRVRERAFLPREQLGKFVTAISASHKVHGPRAKDNCFVFGLITDPADLRLDYDTTILPPKKYFTPQEETLMTFSVPENKCEEPEITGTQVLFGVHPCDLIAIGLMDRVFSDGHCDRNYRLRRELSYLVGLNCSSKCNQYSYCDAMVSYKTDSGYDLMLTPVDGGYALEVASEKGAELLRQANGARELAQAEYTELKRFEKERERAFAARPVNFQTLQRDLWRSYSGPIWKQQAELCFSCGVCNVVCPTCYCFDVCEETEIGGEHGERRRSYDGCMIRDFTTVATGEVFREKREARLRHRELRKGLYLPEKYDTHTFCVGCGRCVKNCLVRISPLETFQNAQKERR